MKCRGILLTGMATFAAAMGTGTPAKAATTLQVGSSGKTFASSAVQCSTEPTTGAVTPMASVGLFNPKRNASAVVSLNGTRIANVTAAEPVTNVWFAEGQNMVVVALGRKVADRYAFTVSQGQCNLPDTSGNTFSADDTLEYAASGKSYATVAPGCAMNPVTGQPQPYVNLFDNGGFMLNISVNGAPLTQLSARKPHTPVFLSAGQNVISAVNGSLSTDYFVRSGGDGQCVLLQ